MKKSGRLNDTKALQSVAAPSAQNEEVSVSVRKIDNGFVRRVSNYSPGGGYECNETYSVEKPSLIEEGKRPSTSGALKGATSYLNRK